LAGRALPRPTTSFVGRGREVAALATMLGRDDVRLLTLTGPGGIGKTRLALHVAETIGDAYDEVAFVPLVAASEPSQLAVAIGGAIGDGPTWDHLELGHSARVIGERAILLVLDGFERLVAAGPLLVALLESCPRLRLLVTSREALHVSGEFEFPVAPLSLRRRDEETKGRSGTDNVPFVSPSPRLLVPSEAVQLFVERARSVVGTFDATGENAAQLEAICARLEGLPLAIELAAVRIKVLTPASLLARLDHRLELLVSGPRDAPERLRTMRGAITWSHDLLGDEERVLFRRLAVFEGGCTLDAAEAVGRGDGEVSPSPRLSVLELIASLIDKSLVQQETGSDDEPRFAMLETVREFAGERLAESGEANEIQTRQAAWFLALAEAAEPRLYGGEQGPWLDRLVADEGNLRAALTWSLGGGDVDLGVRLAGALWGYWFNAGGLVEGSRWLAKAAAVSVDRPARVRLPIVGGAALLAMALGDFDRAETDLASTHDLAESLADPIWLGLAHFGRGVISQDRGDPGAARRHFEAALAAFSAPTLDPTWADTTRANLGLVVARTGDLSTGQALLEASLAGHLAAGHAFGAALARRFLGQIARAAGEPARAAGLFRDSLRVDPRRAQIWHVAGALEGYALAMGSDRAELAAQLLGAAAALRDAGSVPIEPALAGEFARDVDAVRSRLGPARFEELWVAGRRLTAAEAIAAIDAAGIEPVAAPADPIAASGLSPRELEVLRLLAAGRSSREIAADLFISPRTATTHVGNILGKLDVESRAAAIATAYRLGILAAPAPASDRS
jgi:non-specific serine/threonine protein kinase